MRCVSDKGMISIKVHFHRELLAEDGGTPFTCPEGARWFKRLDTLFQHAWSMDRDGNRVFESGCGKGMCVLAGLVVS